MPEIITRELIDLGDQIVDGLNSVNDTIIEREKFLNGQLSLKKNDVTYYNWDGSIAHAYTAEDFLKLRSEPFQPPREGWENRGWNWNLADAQRYVSKYGKLNVGGMYNPLNVGSATRITIDIPEDGRLMIPLCFQQNVSKGVEINWGDGSEPETFKGVGVIETSHTYSDFGEYVISIDAVKENVEIKFGDGTEETDKHNIFGEKYNLPPFEYSIYLKKVRIGSSVREICDYNFACCYNLKELILTDTITSIGNNAFTNCVAISEVTFLEGLKTILKGAFYGCSSLKTVIIPNSTIEIGFQAFAYSNSLEKAIISNSVSSIGVSAFLYDVNLSVVNIPDTKLTIGKLAFAECKQLKEIILTDSIIDVGDNGTFNNCYNLQKVSFNVKTETIPFGMFSSCCALKEITIPESVVNIKSNAFDTCYVLEELVLPSKLINIESRALQNCNALKTIHLGKYIENIGSSLIYGAKCVTAIFIEATVPPVLENVDSFINGNIVTIYVPYSEDHSVLNAYKTATNWSNYADQMVEMPANEE